jgi:hypothetical protein
MGQLHRTFAVPNNLNDVASYSQEIIDTAFSLSRGVTPGSDLDLDGPNLGQPPESRGSVPFEDIGKTGFPNHAESD